MPPTVFDAEQFEECYALGAEDHYWHVARSAIIAKQIRIARASRVLDVGCGRGILVDYLRARGVDCYGSELADVEIPDRLQEHIQTGMPATELPAEFRNSIDTIILGDVIEHLPTPIQFLKDLSAAYPNVRTMVIAVPAQQELFSNFDKRYGHFLRYDLDLLRRTVEMAGFVPAMTSYMFHLLYLPVRILLATRGRRSTKFPTAGRFRLLHRLMGACFMAEFALLPHNWRGTSLICRATRLE